GNPGRLTSIVDLDTAHFDLVIATHLRAVVLGMKHAAPAMIRQRSGSIINTGSIAGLRAGFSAHSYSAAKAATIHVTRCAATELGEKGVRVNSISPGAIVTGIFAKGAGVEDTAADGTADGLKERFAAFQPLPRAGLPEDIAQAALFLASDAGSFVNGQDLVVDGGVVAGSRWSQLIKTRTGLAEELRARAEEGATPREEWRPLRYGAGTSPGSGRIISTSVFLPFSIRMIATSRSARPCLPTSVIRAPVTPTKSAVPSSASLIAAPSMLPALAIAAAISSMAS